MVKADSFREGVSPMLRTVLVVFFLLLLLIAPVWIPVPIARVLAARPVATRTEDEED
jgi:hypothetical protein